MPAALFLALLLAVIPPLSPEQRDQLGAADDARAGFDEGALYPLLTNALDWPAGDETGAAVPDYASLRAAPAEHRGGLALIEGEFVAGGPLVDKLARLGPWEPAVRQWFIRPHQKRDEIVAVLLVAPPPELPRMGQDVRLVARFYKVWNHTGERGNAVPLLTFVGRGAKVLRPAVGGSGTDLRGPGLALGLVGLGVIYFIARQRARGRNRTLAEVRAQREAEDERRRASAAVDEGPPLPDDPAAALEELERRRAERVREQGSNKESGSGSP